MSKYQTIEKPIEELKNSQIMSLRKVGNGCILLCRDSKNKFNVKTSKSIHDVVQYIRGNAINGIYGEFLGKGINRYSEVHRIDILRKSDNTVHKTLCPLCGDISQVYHTQKCGCSIEKPFDGKLKDNALSKQPITISDTDNANLDLKFDRYGNFESERSVKNIKILGNVATGEVKINGKIVLVDQEFEGNFKEQRYYWFFKNAAQITIVKIKNHLK